MMDNMIERMARAVCEADCNTDVIAAERIFAVESYRAKCYLVARDVLAVLREPTPAMLDRFVSRALCVRVSGEYTWTEYGRDQWQAMIDAVDAG